jgi:Protein of unknown function (DUF1566)
MKRTSLAVMALCAMLLWAGAALARTNATLNCQQSKLSADGQLELCLAQNSANILAGGTDSSATCQSNFNSALAKVDATAAKSGAACRYVDNGDGTVSDLNTVLMWEKTTGTVGGTNTGSVNDVNNLYTWSNGDNLADGTAFTSFLATLNNGASTDGGVSTAITGCFANHCDWRLPSIVELQGIGDLSATGCGSGSACIDPTFGPTQSTFYWSATTGAGIAGGAWGVFFNGGYVGFGTKAYDDYVRAVRSGL